MEQPRLAFTVKEFCTQLKISTRHYYSLQAKGEGPNVVRLGRRVLISAETAKIWLLGLETKSAAPTKRLFEVQPGADDSSVDVKSSESAVPTRTPHEKRTRSDSSPLRLSPGFGIARKAW
jgi:hypothetical protein